MEFAIGLWLICGIVFAMIAGNKGHSSGSGFFGGCLFGLFGLIYWLAASDKRSEQGQQQSQHQQTHLLQEQIELQKKQIELLEREKSNSEKKM